jgi:hypothetical protein
MPRAKKKTTTSKKRVIKKATKKTQESAFWTRVVNGMKKILSPSK